ncbi:MAG: DUF3592 domain-containing protein [Peptococcaceae bacterium]|nr:DUF3592 domain-containing protein [Peptococcaceae bacterium]
MGKNTKYNKKTRNGPVVTGTIVSAQSTGVMVGHQPKLEITVEFSAGGKKNTASDTALITINALEQFKPGATLPLRYNPKNPQQIMIADYVKVSLAPEITDSVKCPHCGAVQNINGAYRSAVVCEYCGSAISVKSPSAKPVGIHVPRNSEGHVDFKKAWPVFIPSVLVIIFMIAIYMVSMASWNESEDRFGNILGGSRKGDTNNLSGEELYNRLSSMISQAESKQTIDNTLPDTITFTAQILGASVTMESEGNKHVYLPARIARSRDLVYLDVSAISENQLAEGYPKAGSIIRVTGDTDNTVSWTEDHELKYALRINVKSFVPVEPKVVQTSPQLDVDTPSLCGTFDFKGAHFTRDSFSKVVVIYFNFTGTQDKNTVRPWTSGIGFSVTLGDNDDYLSTTMFPLQEVDNKALETSQSSKKGQTLYYYTPFKVDSQNSGADIVYIKQFDDDFNCSVITLNVAPSLSQMTF